MIPLPKYAKIVVKELLSDMNTLSDFTDVLNFVLKHIDNDKLYKIAPKTLVHYGNYKKRPVNIYKKFVIPKKNGGERIILSPNPSLKLIQRCIATLLSVVYEPNANVMGFVNNRSIKDNAQVHVGKYYVYNIDIKDFFSSISIHRVKAVLKLAPFNLNTAIEINSLDSSNETEKNDIYTEGRERLAFLIANICTFEGVLPQGAPTSPILSNMVCQRLDRRLQGLAKRFGAAYTRYADDITFSSYNNIFTAEFKAELARIIKIENFELNPEKERLQKPAHRQVVTGLTVNEKVNVSQKYIRDLRATLHNWQKFDLEKVINIFNQHQFETKKIQKYEDFGAGTEITEVMYFNTKKSDAIYNVFIKKYAPDVKKMDKMRKQFLNVLNGKIEYLGMIRGKDDVIYNKYRTQFVILQLKYWLGWDFFNEYTFIANEYIFTRPFEQIIQHIISYDNKKIEHNPAKKTNVLNKFLYLERHVFPKIRGLSNSDKIYFKAEVRDWILKHYDELTYQQIAFENEKKPAKTRPINHLPKQTTDFILEFSKQNGVFRQLVHTPNDLEHFNWKAELEKAEAHFKLAQKKYYLPNAIYTLLNEIINFYKNKWDKTKEKHPFYDLKIKEELKVYKKKYRFSATDDETTNLRNLIIDTFCHNDKFESSQIQFKSNKFDMMSSFLADVKAVQNALRKIAEQIQKHGNNVGIEVENKAKRIEISITQDEVAKTTTLIISNLNSIAQKQYPMQVIGGDTQGISDVLTSVCDFAIESTFSDNNTYHIPLLNADNNTDIIKLDTPIHGFTYILTFYR